MVDKRTPGIFPFRIYWWTANAVAACGLIISIYLAVSHYKVHTDIGYRSFCAISNSLDCDTVSQSTYAILLGAPVAVWGALGYVGVLLLLAFSAHASARPRRIWALLLVAAAAFAGYSVALAAVSAFRIRSYCLMCMALYAVNFFLLYFAWLIRRRFPAGPLGECLLEDIRYLLKRGTPARVSGALFLGAAVGLLIFYPPYWKFDASALPAALASGITDEGLPWIGAETPVLEIVEFTDYQCFPCRKMHSHLKGLLVRYPGAIRLVHRHFPMDHRVNPLVREPYHVGSGQMALLAIYAASQGRFWEMHDLLYRLAGEGTEIDLREVGKKMNLPAEGLAAALKSVELHSKLAADIAFGIGHGVCATPS